MRVLKFKGIDITRDNDGVIYTCPTGKIAKVVFITGGSPYLSHRYNVKAGHNGIYSISPVSANGYLTVAERKIFGPSGTYTGLTLQEDSQGNILTVSGRQRYDKPLKVTDYLKITNTSKELEADSELDILPIKNGIILSEGESVEVKINDNRLRLNYLFKVYEEDL